MRRLVALHLFVASVIAAGSVSCEQMIDIPDVKSAREGTLALGQDEPVALAMWGDRVLWINAGSRSVMQLVLPDSRPTVIAADQCSPSDIAADATGIYWTDACGLVLKAAWVDSAGQPVSFSSAASVSATPQVLAVSNGPMRLVLDASHVYFTSQNQTNLWRGSVLKVPLEGGRVTVLADGWCMPLAITVDGAFVYWTTHDVCGDGRVAKVPLDSGDVVALATGQSAGWLAVDESWVYWANTVGDTIQKVPVGGGSVVSIAQGERASALALDGNILRWGTLAGDMVTLDLATGDTGRFPGWEPAGIPTAIVATEGYVYWAASGEPGEGFIARRAK